MKHVPRVPWTSNGRYVKQLGVSQHLAQQSSGVTFVSVMILKKRLLVKKYFFVYISGLLQALGFGTVDVSTTSEVAVVVNVWVVAISVVLISTTTVSVTVLVTITTVGITEVCVGSCTDTVLV